MVSLGLPHWLIIAGVLLVVAGLIGFALSRTKAVESDPRSEEPTANPRPQMAPLPALLDSNRKERDERIEPPA
jgi:hypothetical protein